MTENLVQLDLAQFTSNDVTKVQALSDKLKLMHRWYRFERLSRRGNDQFAIYSGDRSNKPYTCYRIARLNDGSYHLVDHPSGKVLATARSIDPILDAIPSDFYYAGA
jgi:hypothetical protein